MEILTKETRTKILHSICLNLVNPSPFSANRTIIKTGLRLEMTYKVGFTNIKCENTFKVSRLTS